MGGTSDQSPLIVEKRRFLSAPCDSLSAPCALCSRVVRFAKLVFGCFFWLVSSRLIHNLKPQHTYFVSGEAETVRACPVAHRPRLVFTQGMKRKQHAFFSDRESSHQD